MTGVGAIHQFVAGFADGDAISNEARVLRSVFRGWGCASDIFSEPRCVMPTLRREALDVAGYAARQDPRDVILLHLSIGSAVNEAFARLQCRRAILYHNVTPAVWFETINPQTASVLARAQDQIRRLSGVARVNMADSAFNASEMAAAGYGDVKVLPLAIDFERLRGESDRPTLRHMQDGLTNVLFVGRGAPNKRIEDALKAFYYFHKCVEPRSRFIHAGSYAGTERYRWLLEAQVKALGLEQDAVLFAGAVPQPALNALYGAAGLFLCMSEHEGFGVPLIESMVHDLPVLAFRAGAVAETLDGAGVLFSNKNFIAVAEMMGRLTRDAAFRQAVIDGQRKRLRRYEERDVAAELRRHLAPLLADA